MRLAKPLSADVPPLVGHHHQQEQGGRFDAKNSGWIKGLMGRMHPVINEDPAAGGLIAASSTLPAFGGQLSASATRARASTGASGPGAWAATRVRLSSL
jgi:hypothetical protein